MKRKKHTNVVFDANKMLLSEDSPFTVKEAYKTLRTNVAFSLPGNNCKCIATTSANRGDGKTSVAINLAISIANINKKVIVVDCDMRLPTVASKIGISTRPGLSNLLAGDIESDTPIIRRVKKYGIDVLVSGDVPPDPTPLLSSSQMTGLIDTLRNYYDYIILDFPPVYMVTDAAILSKYIDGYLIIVRHDSSEYSKIQETLRQLDFADAKIIGFVYNCKSNDSNYKNGKKYYYYNKYYKKSDKN